MQKNKKWETLYKFKNQKAKCKIEDLIKILLENRGIKTKKEIEEFLNPKLEEVTSKSVGIDQKQLQKSLKRIIEAIEKKEQIVVFGDYDVDGISGTAVLWETLYALGACVVPYIPHRVDEGYGLSIHGIENIKYQISNIKLIITVDNGIVANEAVEFANKEGIDVIITDHHVASEKLPNAYSIVHTTKLCGAGVAYLLAKEFSIFNFQFSNKSKISEDHLALVALATVADLVPLTGANRILLKHGLHTLRKTKRPGLLALFQEAVIDQEKIDTYHIGHIIAPRLNAAGRMEYAMDALRLLCTKDARRAAIFAQKLGETNRERQGVTFESAQHAVTKLKTQIEKLKATTENSKLKKLLFVAEEDYQQGIIGLVAGRLVEEFYRPSIVVSIGETHSKASARSVSGFNIIEFIRSASHLLINAGGHPMAAGFTVETAKLTLLQQFLEEKAETLLTDDHFIRTLRIDCQMPLELVNEELYTALQIFSPFGMANPEPTFVSRGVVIEDMRFVGREKNHVKFKFKVQSSKFKVTEGIGFGLGEKSSECKVGDKVDIVYTIDQDTWNGNKRLQLKIKDIQTP